MGGSDFQSKTPERRASPRVALAAFLRVGIDQADAFVEGNCRNIGAGGVFFESRSLLAVGTQIRLEIALPDGAILEADGEIAWTRIAPSAQGPAGMGAQFTAMSEAALFVLQGVMAERARQEQPARPQAPAVPPPPFTPPPPPPAFTSAPAPPRFTPPPPAPASARVAAPLPSIGAPVAAPIDLQLMPPAGSHGSSAGRPLALPAGTRPKAFQFPPLEGKATKRMIGIDLGTAFSCAAYVKDGAPHVIPGDKGKQSFPSAVFVRGDQTILGSNARERMETSPANVIHSWKRLMGRRFTSPSVRDATDHLSYDIQPGPRGEALVRIDDVLYWPSWFAARVLYEIRIWTRDHLGEVVSAAVITVPAYYTNAQRGAVKEAAALAGFYTVRLLNEPVAASIAYGMGKELDKRLLVYDLGGGTFDVSVVEADGNLFQVIATGGDSYLGGVDFDDRIMGHLLMGFMRQENVSLMHDPVALARLRAASEKAKLELSASKWARVSLPHIAKRGEENLRLEADLSREDLENITIDLVDRTLRACDAVLAQAGLQASEIDEVVLVGGMTRMPLVQSRVESHFGRPPRKGAHPDEAVGVGAALFASSLGSGSMAVLDVLSMAIGVERPQGTFQAVIHGKASLPAEKTLKVEAEYEDQRDLTLEVFQGNSVNIAECEYLGTLALTDLPAADRGALLAEVRFRLDEEGTLSVQSVDRAGSAGPPLKLVIDPRAGAAPPPTAIGRGLGFLKKLLGG